MTPSGGSPFSEFSVSMDGGGPGSDFMAVEESVSSDTAYLSDEFDAAWNRSARSAAVLIELSLSAANGVSDPKTLRLSTTTIDTPADSNQVDTLYPALPPTQTSYVPANHIAALWGTPTTAAQMHDGSDSTAETATNPSATLPSHPWLKWTMTALTHTGIISRVRFVARLKKVGTGVVSVYPLNGTGAQAAAGTPVTTAWAEYSWDTTAHDYPGYTSAWTASDLAAQWGLMADLGVSTELHVSEFRIEVYGVPVSGSRWTGCILDPGTVQAPGEFLSSDVSLCTQTVTLSGSSVVDGSSTIFDLMHGWVWVGAQVVTRLWETSLTDFGDARQVFKGTVQALDIDGETVVLSLRQRVDWNVVVANSRVTREVYPNAPDSAVGTAIPRMWGSFKAPGGRGPFWSLPYAESNLLGRTRGARGVVPGVTVDPGRGAAGATVLFASHELAEFGTFATGTAPAVRSGGEIFSLVGCETFNTASGCGVKVDDITATGRAVSIPNGTLGNGLYSDNAGALIDNDNDQAFCRCQALSSAQNQMYRPGAVFGFKALDDTLRRSIVGATLLVYYRGVVNSSLYIRFAEADGTWMAFRPPTGAGEIAAGPVSTYTWTPWTIDVTTFMGANIANPELFALWVYNYSTTVAPPWGQLDIALAAIEFTFAPTQDYVGTSRAVKMPVGRRAAAGSPYATMNTLPPNSENRGAFYCNASGMPDTSEGTYTGVANALIERPSDIALHVLQALGGQTAAQIETAPATHGSFIDARSSLTKADGSALALSVHCGDDTDVAALLGRVAGQSLSWFTLSPYSDRFLMVPWRSDATTSRSPILTSSMVAMPSIQVSPDSKLPTSIRVQYGYDYFRNDYQHSVSISDTDGSEGYAYMCQNGTSLKVINGFNDKIDLRYKPSDTYLYTTVSLGATADHTHSTLLAALRTAFIVPSALSARWAFAFGGRVETECDWLDFSYGGIKAAQVGTFSGYGQLTMDEVAAAVTLAMNSVSSGFACTYLPATRKFRISRASGTFSLLFASGSHVTGAAASSCAALLGFNATDHVLAGVSSVESDFAVTPGLFAMSSSVAFQLLWRSGDNGGIYAAAPLTAFSVLGFSQYEDGPLGATPYALALNASGCIVKSTLQTDIATSASRYLRLTGAGSTRRPLIIQAKDINDTDTALALRNRLAELTTIPHITVVAQLENIVGLERGEVIEFDAGMDELRPYPDPDSDGSWVGKQLVVVETEQHLGPDSYFTEVVAVSL